MTALRFRLPVIVVATLGVVVFVVAVVLRSVSDSGLDPTESTIAVQSGTGGSNLLGAAMGILVYLLVAGVGLASIVFATAELRRRLATRGLSQPWVTAATAGGAVVAFLGGWLVFDCYVVLSTGWRLLRRPAVAGS